MINLLTGEKVDLTHPGPRDGAVDKPWTRADYLAAMRRLLSSAGTDDRLPAELLVEAAGVLAEAAKSAPSTHSGLAADDVKTGPLTSRVRMSAGTRPAGSTRDAASSDTR